MSDDTNPDTHLHSDVDLTTCDREPIHQLGRVQPFGGLIAMTADWIVRYASSNLGTVLSPEFDNIIGKFLPDHLEAIIVHKIAQNLQFLIGGHVDLVDRVFSFPLLDSDDLFDLAFHRSGQLFVIEIEPSEKNGRNYVSHIRPLIDAVSRADTVKELCEKAAEQLFRLTGFNRVMVYEFDHDHSGKVVAEAKSLESSSFLGLQYPASDIPKQARALYKRSLLRIIADVADPGIPIEPDTEFANKPLDMSLSSTRAVSPIHLEYLKNMGVGASLSVSIIVKDELWGLFACHHPSSKVLSYELRTALELYAQLFSFLLGQKVLEREGELNAQARQLHDNLLVKCTRDNSIATSFDTIADTISPVIPFDGIVGWIGGQFQSRGETPTEAEFKPLAEFLKETAGDEIFHTAALSTQYPDATAFSDKAVGMLALPVSRIPSDYIVIFRQEVAQTINWAGDPTKPATLGPNGIRLTPRKSFESWQEIVQGKGQPWTSQEIQIAQSLRTTMIEVVLLIADQTMTERAKVQRQQDVLIAELNHRVRNSLHLVKSLISQSTDDTKDVASFTEVLGGRIHSLARAHDQITMKNWSPASLSALIETEAQAYFGDKADRVSVRGSDVMLKPNAFTNVVLVIHELMTNSAKYGALCDSKGSITVDLSLENDGGIRLSWKESGGPAIAQPPTRRGFGTTIIENSIPHELDGTASLDYQTMGLSAVFTIPAKHFVASLPVENVASIRPAGDVAETGDPRFFSGDVLIVEDNMLIAIEIEKMVRAMGAGNVHLASNNITALRIIDTHPIGFALLDVNLGDETSAPVAAALDEKSVPFTFASGYGNASAILSSFPSARVVQKPFSQETLEQALGT